MTRTRKGKRHIVNAWTFGLRSTSSEIRVEESPNAPLTQDEARAIVTAIRLTLGGLCSDCHNAARFRIVHASDPTRPRCWDCDQIATQVYAQKE